MMTQPKTRLGKLGRIGNVGDGEIWHQSEIKFAKHEKEYQCYVIQLFLYK